MKYYDVLKNRHSVYNISNEEIVSREKIEEILANCLNLAPSAFNSQTAKVILLFDKQHLKLWDIVKSALKNQVPTEAYSKTEKKINGFQAGYGTVLYFEDQAIVKQFEEQNPLYSDNFQPWSQQSAGIILQTVWLALTAEGLGANIQHYNPLIDADVQKEWNVDKNWKLIGQMPFGKPLYIPDAHTTDPIQERLKVFQ